MNKTVIPFLLLCCIFGIHSASAQNNDTTRIQNQLVIKDVQFITKWYYTIIEANYSPSLGIVDQPIHYNLRERYLGLNLVNGVYLNDYLMLGLGIGFERLRNNNCIPFTFDIRATFSKRRVSPIIGLGFGKSFGLGGFEDNLIINPSVGIRTWLAKNKALLFSVGYRTRAFKTSSVSPSGPFSYSLNTYQVEYRYINFKLGFLF